MDKLFTWLKIDYWYHVFVLLGAAGTIASLIFDIKGITNKQALLLSLGCLFIGIGEWINHPIQTISVPPRANHPGGILTGHPRNPDLLGSLFDIMGFILIATAVYKIANVF